LRKNRKYKKLNGGALYYAIFIFLLVATLSGSIILYTYINNSYIIRQIHQEQVFLNVNSGINLILKNPDLLDYKIEKDINLFGEDYNTVKLKKDHWGAYDLIYSNSRRFSYTASKIALVGDHLGKKESVALYLCDKKKYLSISGNTLLKGTCYLPKLGIKRAYIEGQGYKNKDLVSGKIQQSQNKLPNLNTDKIKYIDALSKRCFTKKDSLFELTEDISREFITNSFKNKPLILFSDQLTNLAGLRVKGNIILKFEQQITIPENCFLKDIIIIAPSVIIDDEFKGSLQIIATKDITVGKSCQLQYPSFLGVLKSKDDELDDIIVGENSIVAGGIMLYSESIDIKQIHKMRIHKSAKVYGLVYCNGFIEHKGVIYGSLYCEGFTLKTVSSLYENHLLNATVNSIELSKDFVGINLVEKPINEQLIKWLD
jgi:hypothetical protein